MPIRRRAHQTPKADSPRSPDPAPRQETVPSPAAGTGIPPRTRAGSTWVLACVAVLALVVLVIFVAQNSALVKVSFLSLHGRFPLAVALLAAAAVGSTITLVLGTTRILQLRRFVRRRQRRHLDTPPRAGQSRVSEGPSGTPQPPHADRNEGPGSTTGPIHPRE